jgi:hypothetical protein
MKFSPTRVRDYPYDTQVRIVKSRLFNAREALELSDRPKDSELDWIIQTALNVIALCQAHLSQLERDSNDEKNS